MSAPSAAFLYRRWRCTLSTPTRGTSHRHCPQLVTMKSPNQLFLRNKCWPKCNGGNNPTTHGDTRGNTRHRQMRDWRTPPADTLFGDTQSSTPVVREKGLYHLHLHWLHVWRGSTWQVHLVQLSTIQSSLSSNRRPSCQHMFFSFEFFILPRASFISVFSSVWKESTHTFSANGILECKRNQRNPAILTLIKKCRLK